MSENAQLCRLFIPICSLFSFALVSIGCNSLEGVDGGGAEKVEIIMEGNGIRSDLYPQDWTPGFKDSEGRSLQDFSYAGYRLGLEPIPEKIPGIVVDVTKPPYSVSNDGSEEATAEIQAAIDFVGDMGGGTVFLPEGFYRVKAPVGAYAALFIGKSGVILKGEGPEKTRIYCDQKNRRNTSIIAVGEPETYWTLWTRPVGAKIKIDQPVDSQTKVISLESAKNLNVGDWVVVSQKFSKETLKAFDLLGVWSDDIIATTYYRQIVRIDSERSKVYLDIPIRSNIALRDDPVVFKVKAHIEESGIEDLAIGHKELGGLGLADRWPSPQNDQYDVQGTEAHLCDQAKAILVTNVVNGWVKNVHSFSHPDNVLGTHVRSSGIDVFMARSISVTNCDMRHPQYEGAGGNGYLFAVSSADSLYQNCVAVSGRHNYSFRNAWTTGNVLLNCVAEHAQLMTDFHMHLSLANLIDNMALKGDSISAGSFKKSGGSHNPHGHTTTESVIWNTYAERPIEGVEYSIFSYQYGNGYVIGTWGDSPEVSLESIPWEREDVRDHTPLDWVEFVGEGEDLVPASLYCDQLERRKQALAN